MREITPEQLKLALDNHKLWLRNEPGGSRADLRNANLSNADLSGADLSSANLRGADLSNANLRNANLSNADLSNADLRDYGVKGQLGLELTPDAYVERMVEVFRLVRRVLRPDGTVWLNLGDSYAQDQKWGVATGGKHAKGLHGTTGIGRNRHKTGLPGKNLIGIPWRVAFALQADGWYLRQDIIWAKPNPMPEPVTDRCTRSHEHIFLLSKEARYYFNYKAIRVPAKDPQDHIRRLLQQSKSNKSSPSEKVNGLRPRGRGGKSAFRGQGHMREGAGPANRQGRDMKDVGVGLMANKRDVWTVTTKPFKGSHFATFPPDLIEPCILAGSKPGDLVLDPFGGAGTTGLVASRLGRRALLIELNPKYIALAKARIKADAR